MANLLGKRYVCSVCEATVLVTNAGDGDVTCHGQAMEASTSSRTREESKAQKSLSPGPFGVALTPTHEAPFPYLQLLGLRDAARTIAVVRLAALEPGAAEDAVNLLRDRNWRVQVMGAVASYVSPSRAAVDQAWRALDAGSWVSPQLAAVLSLIDPDFVDRALGRLDTHCAIRDDSAYRIESPLQRHVEQGPGGAVRRSRKTASALLALLSTDASEDQRVQRCRRDKTLRKLITTDTDRGGEIATTWRDELVRLFDGTRT